MTIARTILAGLAALALASPAMALTQAEASAELTCMADSYTAEQASELDTLSDNYRSTAGDEGGQWQTRVGEVILPVVSECSAQHGWSDSSLFYAITFELSRISEVAYRRSGRLTPVQIERMDTALAERERPGLWAALERAVIAGLDGGETVHTRQDLFLMGSFVVSSGIGSDEEAGEKAGELMGMMALQRYAQREFAALQTQE